jgi:hypothetical protein
MLKYSPTEEENPVQSLTQWEIELNMLEDWLNNLLPGGGYHDICHRRHANISCSWRKLEWGQQKN